jgi:hypothetical protein
MTIWIATEAVEGKRSVDGSGRSCARDGEQIVQVTSGDM